MPKESTRPVSNLHVQTSCDAGTLQGLGDTVLTRAVRLKSHIHSVVLHTFSRMYMRPGISFCEEALNGEIMSTEGDLHRPLRARSPYDRMRRGRRLKKDFNASR